MTSSTGMAPPPDLERMQCTLKNAVKEGWVLTQAGQKKVQEIRSGYLWSLRPLIGGIIGGIGGCLLIGGPICALFWGYHNIIPIAGVPSAVAGNVIGVVGSVIIIHIKNSKEMSKKLSIADYYKYFVIDPNEPPPPYKETPN